MQTFVFICFLGSGFASLVFEIVWERSLVTVFGGTSLALGTLLTAFMSGLALGAFVAGRFAHRIENPFRVYGIIEIGIGCFALVTPTVFSFLPTLYIPWYELTSDVPFLFNLGRFAVAFLVLAIPTTLMGATLPLLSQFVSRDGMYRAKIGGLYAVNTLGACSGCFLAGFVLLPTFGLSGTNSAFAVFDIVLGVVVILVSFIVSTNEPSDTESEVQETFEPSPTTQVPRRLLLGGTALAGFVAMGLQILWTRAYVIVLGSSTYSFSLILTAFLLGLGGGSAVGSMLVTRRVNLLRTLAVSQIGLACLAAVATGFIDYLPTLLFERNRASIGSANEIYLFQFALVAMLVLVPMFLQGMLFPLVIGSVASDRADGGRAASVVYAVNTVGAILGSFTTAFVMMPIVGLQSSVRVVLVSSVVVGAIFSWAFFVSTREIQPRPETRWTFVLLLAPLITIVFATSIDQTELTRGMFRTVWARELFNPKKFLKDRPEILFFEDGMNATISVEKRGQLVTLKSNGKPEASSGADMATQILVAQYPLLLRALSQPRGDEEVAMIGYGSGVTAGAALQWPLRELVVAEIEPAMVGAARFFDEVNHRPDRDPRTTIVANDGRNFLALSERQWDVVISEPSNPWIAGVSSLFTTEHFQLVKSRLKPGGTFSQWVQLYEIHPDNVRDIIATFVDVFPNAVAFSSMPKGTDLILVAQADPIAFGPNVFAESWDDPRTRTELERAGIKERLDLLGLMFWNNQELRSFANGGEKNTDDNLRLEFNAPKDLVRYDVGREYFSDQYFSKQTYGDARVHMDFAGWDDEAKAALIRSVWRAGKRKFAEQLVDQHFPTGDLDVTRARRAASIDVHQAVVTLWPNPRSEWHSLLAQANTPESKLRVMAYLEQDGVPSSGGWPGEKGLAYVYILWSQKYYKHALKQVRVLEKDPVAESALFKLLAGHVLERRRRYHQSFEQFRSVEDAR